MKAWLKGGIIGAGISLLVSLIGILSSYSAFSKGTFFLFLLISSLSSVVIGFCIGAIFGLIIGAFIRKSQSNKKEKMKTWKIGGLIGGLIGLLLAIFEDIVGTFTYLLLQIILLPDCSHHVLFKPFPPGDISFGCALSPLGKVIIFITSLIIYILIGIFVGWVIGKIKSRKQENSSPIK